jgi:hypothetical protein
LRGGSGTRPGGIDEREPHAQPAASNGERERAERPSGTPTP